jgi:hypothetical protein
MQEVVRTFNYYLPARSGGWLRKGRVGSGQRGHGIFMISLWFRSTFAKDHTDHTDQTHLLPH